MQFGQLTALVSMLATKQSADGTQADSADNSQDADFKSILDLSGQALMASDANIDGLQNEQNTKGVSVPLVTGMLQAENSERPAGNNLPGEDIFLLAGVTDYSFMLSSAGNEQLVELNTLDSKGEIPLQTVDDTPNQILQSVANYAELAVNKGESSSAVRNELVLTKEQPGASVSLSEQYSTLHREGEKSVLRRLIQLNEATSLKGGVEQALQKATSVGELEEIAKMVSGESRLNGSKLDSGMQAGLTHKLTQVTSLMADIDSSVQPTSKQNTSNLAIAQSSPATAQAELFNVSYSGNGDSKTELTAQGQLQQMLQRPVAHAEGLAARIGLMLSIGSKVAELQLDPPELGHLQVKIRQHGSEYQVHFSASNGQARDLISEQLPRLRELFAEQGFDLTDSHVGEQGQEQPSHQSRSSQSQFSTGQNTDAAAKPIAVLSLRLVDQFA